MITWSKQDIKVLLVKPPQPPDAVFHIMPPLGLGYIATSIKDRCKRVDMIDCLCDKISHKQLINRISQIRPDIIGFTMLSHDLPTIKKITDAIKNDIPADIITVVGGPHSSSAPEHTLEYLKNVDFAFKGEAEKGFPLLIESIKNRNGCGFRDLDKIPGLIYRANKNVRVNIQDFEENLDRFGFPDWEMINPEKYFKTCHGVFNKSKRFTSIFATRGCPFSCTFCSAHNVVGKSIRKRSVEHIVNEIVYLHDKYNIQEFHLLDDHFTFDNRFAASFCDALIEKNMNISWACPNGVRIDSLNETLLAKMKKSGCESLFFGLESGSQSVLNRMKKGLVLDEVVSKMDMVKKMGFFVTAFFILGFPGEQKDDMEKTIRFACSLPIDVADFSNFLPIPGAAVLNEFIGADKYNKINYARISSPAHVTNDADHTERKDIQIKMIRRAYLSFYLRPRILFNLLKRIRSTHQVYAIFKRVYAYMIRTNK